MTLKYLIFIAAIGVVAYWWVNRPIPGVEDAWKLRIATVPFMGVELLEFLTSCKILSRTTFVSLTRAGTSAVGLIKFGSSKSQERLIAGVRTLVFVPTKPKDSSHARPAVIYFHSGGFMHYYKALASAFCRHISETINAVVISVEYSLSPEAQCPTAFDESLAVTKYILDYSQEFGVDSNRIAVMGTSAGGAIAVSVAYRLSTELGRTKTVKLQVAINPLLQLFTFNLPSQRNVAQHPGILNKRALCVYGSAFLTASFDYIDELCNDTHTLHLNQTHFATLKEVQSSNQYEYPTLSNVSSPVLPVDALHNILDPNYFPFMASDLERIPPLFLVTAEYDVLRDEGFLFADRLQRLRLPVTHKHYFTYHASLLVDHPVLSTKGGTATRKDILSFLETNL